MTILVVSSAFCETNIPCPHCGWTTYSDGKTRPECGNPECLEFLSDEEIYTFLITREDSTARDAGTLA
jgi:tRNA(Ile2) C34 agmatinyltransferase TiaS